jgi:proline iminopeptidase
MHGKLKWLCMAVAICVTAMGYAPAEAKKSSAPAKDEQLTRSEVTGIIRDLQKIVTPNGVEEQLLIPVDDTKQWISVRGRDRSNPVLLIIHGGPASPEMPIAWAYQTGLEDFYTVVQWDQRGSGKTFLANDPEKVGPTLSLDRIVEDAGEVVQYLRQRYDKDKIFVLGHSWGSIVGISLAKRHPEMLHAYIGMGQVINGFDNEREGYEQTLALARKAGNKEAVAELESIAPYPEIDGELPLAKINLERKWSIFYGGLTYGRSTFDYYSNAERLSPEYSTEDLKAIGRGSRLSLERLLPELGGFNFTNVTQFDCPIVMFAGRHDLTTPSNVTAEWIDRVEAPSRAIYWFENSAHMMTVEEPGRLLLHLVQDVRPLAAVSAPRKTVADAHD